MGKEVATILIKMPTPSNQAWERMHWRKQHEVKDQWKWMVKAARNNARISAATGKRIVRVTRHGVNLLDEDNLYGGLKPLMDALTSAGLIVDDKPQFCKLYADQVKIGRSGTPFTSVVLEEAEDA